MKRSLISIVATVLAWPGMASGTLTELSRSSIIAPSPKVSPINIMIRDLEGRTRNLLLGGSEGHGGDFREMAISNLAWEVYASLSANANIVGTVLQTLESAISNLEVEIVDALAINDLKRDAINIPSQVKIYLTDEGYEFLTDDSVDFKDRAQFLLHELLPIMGSDDSDYKTSEFLANALKREGEQARGNLYEVLYSTQFDDYYQGLRFSDANQICESVKESYRDQYFAVYCT